MFHFYQESRVEGESFNQVMGGVMANQSGWLEIFPHGTLLSTAKPDGPLLVDVGGNIGHDLDRFYQVHPETGSRLYLEDLDEVVSLSKCSALVNKIAHDFFTPQPIKGNTRHTFTSLRDTFLTILQAHGLTTCMESFTTGPTSQHGKSWKCSGMR